ncbi:DUF2917 domain-containing protein [Trinickia fusca]|uniref:DUF2917 domain-containing protein n=1 Tax=Trinickia fusca TaxID=2419777 RepID=A0A494XG84_9BURK|nr:DUF2917 domain-containing protein [Trinickia fusca]RKP49538.1 DUF2917 domain-containing protein [Trinickia fusca]
MREISSSITFEVEPNETVPMMIAHSTRLRVSGACVWVTRSNDIEDYLLADGESLVLRRGERLWLSVCSSKPAQVAFSAPLARSAVARDWFATQIERLAAQWRGGWRTV